MLIAVKNKYNASLISEFQSDAEDIWISIKLNENSLLIVCCVYLPPGDKGVYTMFSSELANIKFNVNATVVICGDVNFSTTK